VIFPNSGILKKILWIAVLAFAIRLAYISLNTRSPYSDEFDYQKLAVTLSTEHRYALDSIPTAYRPIGYPAFIALVYLLAGIHPVIVKVVQAVLDSMIVVCLPLLIPESTEKTKTWAAVFWAVFPPAILYPNLLMTETMYTFLVVCGAVLFVQRRDLRAGGQILLGLIFGGLTLIKPATGVFLMALVIFEWVYLKSAKSAAIISLTCILVVLPWTIRNWVVLGEPTLATSSGMNLLIGNNPHANGSYTSQIDVQELEAVHDEATKDRLAFRTATGYILSHPELFLLNGIRKLAHFFSSESFLLVSQFHTTPADFGIALSKKYAAISPLLILVVNAGYFVLLIAGWLGVLASGGSRTTQYFALLLGSLLFVHVLTFGGNRFHFPLMPFFAAFSAQQFMNAQSGVFALSRPRQIAFLLPVMGVLSIWIVEFAIILRA
jgi:hypothetical protein